MPRKSKSKGGKTGGITAGNKMNGGYFWEQKDPYFGSFNKGVAKIAGNVDDALKKSKIISSVAKPILTSLGTATGTALGALGGPAAAYGASAGAYLGDKAGGYASDYLAQKGYGVKPPASGGYGMRGRGGKTPNTGSYAGLNPPGPNRSSANKNMKGGRKMRGGATASSQGGVYAPRGYMPGLPESMPVGRTQDYNPIMRGGALIGFPNTGINGSINFNAGALITK